jgi:hypothetical protein
MIQNKDLDEILRNLDIHYGWVSKTPKVAGRGITHLVNGDLEKAKQAIQNYYKDLFLSILPERMEQTRDESNVDWFYAEGNNQVIDLMTAAIIERLENDG